MSIAVLRRAPSAVVGFADRHWIASWITTVVALGLAAEPLLVLARISVAWFTGFTAVFTVGCWVVTLPILGFLAWWLVAAGARWLHRPRRQGIAVGLAVFALGAAPWLAPVDVMMPLAHPWNLHQAAWVLNSAVWPLAALLAIPGLVTRICASAAAAVLIMTWTPLQSYLIAAHAPHLLRLVGDPPRSELRAVNWSGMAGDEYVYSGGTVSLEYDMTEFAGMSEFAGELTVTPASQASACTMPIPLLGDQLPDCRRQPDGEWYLTDAAGDCDNGCAAVVESDGYLIQVYETESSSSPSDDPRVVLQSQHQASDTELYYMLS